MNNLVFLFLLLSFSLQEEREPSGWKKGHWTEGGETWRTSSGCALSWDGWRRRLEITATIASPVEEKLQQKFLMQRNSFSGSLYTTNEKWFLGGKEFTKEHSFKKWYDTEPVQTCIGHIQTLPKEKRWEIYHMFF